MRRDAGRVRLGHVEDWVGMLCHAGGVVLLARAALC